jgi:hypothetical protein
LQDAAHRTHGQPAKAKHLKEIAMSQWNDGSRLLLSAREAAAALSICEKTLWSITRPRGDLPCVRIGRRVLYSVVELNRRIGAPEKGGEPA